MVRNTPMTEFVNDVISLGIFVELYAKGNIRSTDNGEIAPINQSLWVANL